MHRILPRVVTRTVIRNLPKMPSPDQPQIPKVFGRTFSQQGALPRLPVPALEQTIQKYLRTVQPLTTEEEFEETKKIAEAFLQGPGPKLQMKLEERAAKNINWLSDWWKRVAYLDLREPVVINSNPGVLFPKQNYSTQEGQLRFAARLIAGVIDYKMMIDNQTLPVEMLGKNPMCMIQFYKILSACRTPGLKHDEWTCYPSDQSGAPNHITVVHNNTFFSLEVYDKDKNPLNVEQLYQQLQQIVNQSDALDVPLGVLTFEHRHNWAVTYKKLMKADIHNRWALDNIQRSIFVLCIDQPWVETYPDPMHEKSVGGAEMLHGGHANCANRWFDKTLQFIVGANGICGLNYEHTTAEGPPIISIMDHALAFCDKMKDFEKPASNIRPPKKLRWNLSSSVHEDIDRAKANAEAMIDDVDLSVFKFSEYGKNFPKSQKLSPDSYIQMAFQLAYYRIHKEPCATYETGTLRKFQMGRTDTIRSCSNESFEFSRAMDDPDLPKEKKAELLKKAVVGHKNYTNEVVNGQGIDRHLLGMKLAAVESGMNLPDLHMDPAYNKSFYFKLSTSQVPAKAEAVLFFGPVVPDGYGLCYNPQETQIVFGVSAFNNCKDTHSRKMVSTLKKSLIDMRDVLIGSLKSNL